MPSQPGRESSLPISHRAALWVIRLPVSVSQGVCSRSPYNNSPTPCHRAVLCTSFHVVSQRAECSTIMYCDGKRPHSHNFYYMYNCNYSVLLLVVNLLLCLIYELNFSMGMCVLEKTQYMQGAALSSGVYCAPPTGKGGLL